MHFAVSTLGALVRRSESGGPHGAPARHPSVCLLPTASYCLHGAWRQRPHSGRSTPPRDRARAQPQLLTFACAVVPWPGRSPRPRYWVRSPSSLGVIASATRLCTSFAEKMGGEGNSPWKERSRRSFLQNAWNLESAPRPGSGDAGIGPWNLSRTGHSAPGQPPPRAPRGAPPPRSTTRLGTRAPNGL